MFKKGIDIKGGCYVEFQFCTDKTPLNSENINFWHDDSLVIDYDEFSLFYSKYEEILNCALLPNKDTGFDGCGINYYDAEKTKSILHSLKHIIKEEYKMLIPWLEEADKNKKGFYILGV